MTRWRQWFGKFDVFSPKSVQTLIWLGLALFCLGLFVKVTWELYEDSKLATLDIQILFLIAQFRVSALNGAAIDLTALGSPTVLTLFTLIGVALLWLNGDRRGSGYLMLGSLGSAVATLAMKLLFTRERPSVLPRLIEVSGFSYPSGHSLAATSFYLLLMFLAWRHYRSWSARAVLAASAGLLIGLVCFSRLYLGVHYPSDVLSGVCLGAAWTFILTAWFSRLDGRPLSTLDATATS